MIPRFLFKKTFLQVATLAGQASEPTAQLAHLGGIQFLSQSHLQLARLTQDLCICKEFFLFSLFSLWRIWTGNARSCFVLWHWFMVFERPVQHHIASWGSWEISLFLKWGSVWGKISSTNKASANRLKATLFAKEELGFYQPCLRTES